MLFPLFPFSSVHFEPILIPVTSSRIPTKYRSRSHSAPQSVGSHSQPSIDIPTSVGEMIISVTDSGPGLSEDQQKILFQEGVQFNPNELQAGQGSGLGLWISREIISLHEGKIDVSSEGLGKGSTFRVSIPVYLQGGQDVEEAQSLIGVRSYLSPSVSPIPDTKSDGKHLLILCEEETQPYVLVVDDAASNRKLVCRMLKNKGYICHEAEDGKKCLEMIEKQMNEMKPSYDFILLDFEMPIMDGPSTVRHLRERNQFGDLLIIGVTGNVLSEDVEYFLKCGVNAVFPKPVKMDELLDYIQNIKSSNIV